MPDFWRHSGYHLAEKDAAGRLLPTDDLLRAYFARPEVAPVEGSCAHERALFARLMAHPRGAVDAPALQQLADPDARENYAVVLRLREHLLRSGTLEAAYRSLFVGADGSPVDFAAHRLPPLFADQLAHMILRNLLGDDCSALVARAAEIFFRDQRAHAEDGRVLLADSETVAAQAERASGPSAYGNIGRLLAAAQAPLRAVELDVLDEPDADRYWARDERHDTALQINFGRAGLAALCRAIERWVAHFFGIQARVEPLRSLDSARMRWYSGLDAASSALMNAIYNRQHLGDGDRRRILCMLRLQTAGARSRSGEPHDGEVYLALAMDEQGNVRMKPQNLLTNLPFAPCV